MLKNAFHGPAVVLALAWVGCVGDVEDPSGFAANGGSAGTTGHPPLGNHGKPVGELDVNRVALHRLNNTEYDNTMQALLGVKSTAGAAFIADEKLLGFDNIAAALGMTAAQYEQYFNTADTLVEEAFSEPALQDRVMICAPQSSDDQTCAAQIIESFGRRAFRRPLQADEVARLTTLVIDAIDLGEDFEGGIKTALKAMLASPAFLYRVELDPDPGSTAPRALNGYELASRLSYLVWSSMPDDELFALAESGKLLEDDVLAAQLERLLQDERSRQLVASFAGQWLGLRDLVNHQVEPSAFPAWNESLRRAMIDEGYLYFSEFLSGDRALSEFFTADVRFVNDPLAALYGMPQRPGQALLRVTDSADQRRGFAGLASFLTVTSFSYRTAPTLRGKWVLENLLCEEIAPPPPNVPKLDTDATGASSGAQSQNVRERLEQHRENPVCASCHRMLDPIGLGLESFDATGRYRTTYANGDAVDASGELPDGARFDGLMELSTLLSQDERFSSCASKKLMTYALSREIVASDAPYLQQIRERWRAEGLGFKALLRQIVQSDTFRYRRGESG